MSKRCAWNSEEQTRLQGLSMLAQLVYLRGLRWRMDYTTGVAGGLRGLNMISYNSLIEDVEFVPDFGSREQPWRPTLGKVRAALRELERAHLIADAGSSKRTGIVKRLLWADVGRSVQNRNDTGTTQERHERNDTTNTTGSDTGNNAESYSEYSDLESTCDTTNTTGSDAGNNIKNMSYPQDLNEGATHIRYPVSERRSNSSSIQVIPHAHVDPTLTAALRICFPQAEGAIQSPTVQRMLLQWTAAGVTQGQVAAVYDAVRQRDPTLGIGPAYLEGPMRDVLGGKRVGTKPPWADLPVGGGHVLMAFAKQHGYPGPGTRTDAEYRSLLRSEINKRLAQEESCERL